MRLKTLATWPQVSYFPFVAIVVMHMKIVAWNTRRHKNGSHSLRSVAGCFVYRLPKNLKVHLGTNHAMIIIRTLGRAFCIKNRSHCDFPSVKLKEMQKKEKCLCPRAVGSRWRLSCNEWCGNLLCRLKRLRRPWSMKTQALLTPWRERGVSIPAWSCLANHVAWSLALLPMAWMLKALMFVPCLVLERIEFPGSWEDTTKITKKGKILKAMKSGQVVDCSGL